MTTTPGFTFPAAHALQLVTLLRRWDIPAETLLRGSSWSQAELEAPRARISLDTLRALTRRARELTAEPGIGFYLGLQKRLTMYGYVGFGAMSASTVGEALELVVRFTPTISTAIGLALSLDDATATLELHEHVDMGDVHDVALFSLLVGMRELAGTMTGLAPERLAFDLPIAEPAYFPRFAHLMPVARFDQPVARIRFDRSDLEVPLLHSDRAAMLLAREQCERDLEALGFEHQLPERVRRELDREPARGIEAVAGALRMSTRTLKRKLAAQGFTFTELVNQQRLRCATELLREPTRSLEDVAEALGYSSLPNFARAFRRWTGESPAQFRRRTASG